jgi:carboxymethylenebutenolidase
MSAIAVSDVPITEHVEGASPRLHGALAVPAGEGPWPGVVVLHEAFGIDREMRKHVAHLASLGYIALMPDLYSNGGFRKCISATVRAMTTGRGVAYSDIEAARRALLGRNDCTGSVGVLGFCLGGGFALMSAPRGFDAASANYGILPRNLDETLENSCPIVASYGKNDLVLKNAARKLDAALSANDVPHDVKEYPGAGHVFMNDELVGPLWLRPMVRVLGFGPRPDAAADAWARIERFFARYL